uniref:Uncharacterized protein n=1 Tax=Ditylenchus dipsaci TaxID=166011 RepID=A0A915CSK3_9BILA
MSSCLIFTFLFTFVLVVTLLPLNASSLGDSHESDGHSQHHNAFGNTDGGHESGYELAKQGGHHDDHAIHEAAATHQATGDGEKSRGASAHHTTMEADGSAAKFHEADSQHGKDLKAKTFGFFDYRFIQPQYHVEQFYEDEKQGKQYGADKHKAGEVDHHHDEHETDGKDRFEESHNLGAHGAADYSKGVDGIKAAVMDGVTVTETRLNLTTIMSITMTTIIQATNIKDISKLMDPVMKVAMQDQSIILDHHMEATKNKVNVQIK